MAILLVLLIAVSAAAAYKIRSLMIELDEAKSEIAKLKASKKVIRRVRAKSTKVKK